MQQSESVLGGFSGKVNIECNIKSNKPHQMFVAYVQGKNSTPRYINIFSNWFSLHKVLSISVTKSVQSVRYYNSCDH